MLLRILRGLVLYGLLAQEENGRFKLTELGECLRTDISDSMYERAIGIPLRYRAWGALLHTIQTGEIAFNHVFNMGFFEYCAQNREFGEQFDRYMVNRTSKLTEGIIAAYDFSSFKKIVDVGGGSGTLITEILKADPHMTGILYDMESVVGSARKYLRDEGVTERCEIVSGSFFDSIPEGGDGYILKSILHDWDDDSCLRILKNCHRAMEEKSKLLVMEHVMSERVDQSTPVVDSDLRMMVVLGGKERTETEYRSLFASAGFNLDQIIPAESDFSVLECVLL